MSRRKTTSSTATAVVGSAAASSNGAPAGQNDEAVDFDEYAKQFEPVAPWNRPNIPDYGPLQDHMHLIIFVAVGLAATIAYEYTDYFDEINRVVAYVAIWFPLWFRLLTRVAPLPTDEEAETREQREFKKELERIQKEAEFLDD